MSIKKIIIMIISNDAHWTIMQHRSVSIIRLIIIFFIDQIRTYTLSIKKIMGISISVSSFSFEFCRLCAGWPRCMKNSECALNKLLDDFDFTDYVFIFFHWELSWLIPLIDLGRLKRMPGTLRVILRVVAYRSRSPCLIPTKLKPPPDEKLKTFTLFKSMGSYLLRSHSRALLRNLGLIKHSALC